jgi:hypothetical protein
MRNAYIYIVAYALSNLLYLFIYSACAFSLPFTCVDMRIFLRINTNCFVCYQWVMRLRI